MPFDLERYLGRLRTNAVGRRVEYREQTGSTMDDARALVDAEPGVAPGSACIGGEQLSGRGRLGRHWVSAPGIGLYVTFHLRPAVVANAPLISLAAALAVADAVQAVSDVRPVFKWPNDVLVGGKKLCGILAESRGSGGRFDVFLGIGINVRPNPNHPPEVASIATSIEGITGTAPAIEDLAAELSNALEEYMAMVDGDPSEVVAAWRANLGTLGQQVSVATASGVVEGRAADVGPRGELIVEGMDGTRYDISAGDVIVGAGSGSAPGSQTSGEAG